MDTLLSPLSLIPALTVFITGLISRKVLLSLFLGILTASLIACDYQLKPALGLLASSFWTNLELKALFNLKTFASCWNPLVFFFIFSLGVFIAIMQQSGAAFAYGRFIQSRIQKKQNAEVMSLILSKFLFVDDYFSSLTTGSVMRPIADLYKISRVKLAYLVDAMSAPLIILCPVSSWVAVILGLFRENGFSTLTSETTQVFISPYQAYLNVIPYIFYSFIVIICTWFIVLKSISFGLMKKHELAAEQSPVGCGQAQTALSHTIAPNSTMLDFIIPIIVLVGSIIFGILFAGGYFLFGGENNLSEAFQNTSAALALFMGGILTLSIVTLFVCYRGNLTFWQLPRVYGQGIKLMAPAVLTILMAWVLGHLMKEHLHTGEYLANFILSFANVTVLPCLFFVVSVIAAFATGTSWGTVGIMFPLAVSTTLSTLGISEAVEPETVQILFLVIGAVLSGCVAGDHISPISDTSLMSSTSTQCSHIAHIQTQLCYAGPLICVTALLYYFAGLFFCENSYWPTVLLLSTGILLSMGLLYWLHYYSKARKPKPIATYVFDELRDAG